jgi:hypothetical protein
MPKQQWANEEEREWLMARLPAFVEAQEQKSSSGQFFSPIYTQWFEEFPAR